MVADRKWNRRGGSAGHVRGQHGRDRGGHADERHAQAVFPAPAVQPDALGTNRTLPGTVEASAHNGNVTLTGTVRSGYQRAAAEATVAT